MHLWFGLSWALQTLTSKARSLALGLWMPLAGMAVLEVARFFTQLYLTTARWSGSLVISKVQLNTYNPTPIHPFSNKNMLQHRLVDHSPLASQWSRLLCWGTDAAAWQVSIHIIHWCSNDLIFVNLQSPYPWSCQNVMGWSVLRDPGGLT